MFNAAHYLAYLEANKDLPHVSKYHREGYLEHCQLVVYAICSDGVVPVSRRLYLAATLHDISKPRTQGYNKVGEPCFYGHEEITDEELSQFLSPNDDDYKYVKALILCHGLPYKVLTAADYLPTLVKSCAKTLRNAKSTVKVDGLFMTELMLLHSADDKGSVRNDADLEDIAHRCEVARRLVSSFQ